MTIDDERYRERTQAVFMPAEPHFRDKLSQRRQVLHELAFLDDGSVIGRVHVGVDGNTAYYAPEHELPILSGIKIIEGSLQAAAAAISRRHAGIPVWKAASFEQAALALPGRYVDFHAFTGEEAGRLTGFVEISNEKGEVFARTTGMKGVLEQPESAPPNELLLPSDKLWVPHGAELARPLLSPIYDESKIVLDLFEPTGENTGNGYVLVGENGNTDYYPGHRSDEVAEPILVHAAMQAFTLTATQGKEPGSLLTLYSGGSFQPESDAPMGEVVRIEAKTTVNRSDLAAEADIYNLKGDKLARISGITAKIASPRVIKRLLQVAATKS